MALPNPGVTIDAARTAIVIIDPQNDFLSPNGVAWGVIGESVTANNTVANIEALMKASKQYALKLFISPHYYFPADHQWKFEGALEKLMHNINMFDRPGPLQMDGFIGSGADWLDLYKPYIEDNQTIVCSPHKVYGPENNDLILQLRKQRIETIILGGMSSNLCVESHLREFLEHGFEVAVVKDATAGAQVPEGDGYASALVNYRMLANTVWSTQETLEVLEGALVKIAA